MPRFRIASTVVTRLHSQLLALYLPAPQQHWSTPLSSAPKRERSERARLKVKGNINSNSNGNGLTVYYLIKRSTTLPFPPPVKREGG
jgi:hypothetical protein